MSNKFQVGDTVERFRGGTFNNKPEGYVGKIVAFDNSGRHAYFGEVAFGTGHVIHNLRLVKPATPPAPALLTEAMKFRCSKGKTYATALTALKASTRNTVAPDLTAAQVETLILNRDVLREVFDLADKYDVEKVGV